MFKKIKEFFRVLGELKYIIPLLKYKFPDPDDNESLAHSFEKTVEEFGNNNFIFFEDESWSYSETNKAANSLANKLLKMESLIVIELFCLWKIVQISLLAF